MKWKSLSHVRLCDPIDCIVHRILQARILKWAAFPFFQGIFPTQGLNQVSRIAGWVFTSWAVREAWFGLKRFTKFDNF